mgnify:FL=1
MAVDTSDLERYIKIMIEELETKIIECLQNGLSKVIFPVHIGDYNMPVYSRDDSTKIIVYNLIKTLQSAKYSVKLVKTKDSYNLNIDISNRSGSKTTAMLNDYLNKFL